MGNYHENTIMYVICFQIPGPMQILKYVSGT